MYPTPAGIVHVTFVCAVVTLQLLAVTSDARFDKSAFTSSAKRPVVVVLVPKFVPVMYTLVPPDVKNELHAVYPLAEHETYVIVGESYAKVYPAEDEDVPEYVVNVTVYGPPTPLATGHVTSV